MIKQLLVVALLASITVFAETVVYNRPPVTGAETNASTSSSIIVFGDDFKLSQTTNVTRLSVWMVGDVGTTMPSQSAGAPTLYLGMETSANFGGTLSAAGTYSGFASTAYSLSDLPGAPVFRLDFTLNQTFQSNQAYIFAVYAPPVKNGGYFTLLANRNGSGDGADGRVATFSTAGLPAGYYGNGQPLTGGDISVVLSSAVPEPSVALPLAFGIVTMITIYARRNRA